VTKRSEQEVDEELRFYLEEREREFIARGMTPEHARRAVAERFGDLSHVRNACTRLLGAERAAEERRTHDTVVAIMIIAVTISVLLLTAGGIYAMMSFTVARRRREIGIRAALGADARRVLIGIFGRRARSSAQASRWACRSPRLSSGWCPGA
jgi:hypothetical protein